MNSHENASRITDVVPANFLCDNQTMQKIAESQVSDEKALSLLQENLSGLELRRQSLKDELANVERLISEAVAEQTRLRSSIETHKSLLAYTPVRALPGEVLSEIFLHYVAISQPTRGTVFQGTVFQEIIAYHRNRARILQVCRRWRATALDDLRLWTAIPLIGSGERFNKEEATYNKEEKSFTHPMISGSPQERTAYWKALGSRLERMSSLPLQLLFHFNDCRRINNRGDAIASLQTFIRLFPRADTISICVYNHKELLPKVTAVMTDAEILHADQVHTARIHVSDSVFRRKLLSAIPNVEVLEVETSSLDQWFIDVPTAGHRLRSLHVLTSGFTISFTRLTDLLDRAPLLETLKIARIVFPHSATLRPVTHMLLSTFYLSHASQAENDAIFKLLTFPALRSLSFGGSDNHYLWPRPSNLAFLRRSGCMLTELAFHKCLVHEEGLVELLTAHSKLATLQLEKGAPIPMPIIDFLSTKPKGASDRPLPALTVLKISVLPRQLKAVKRLIQSRSATQAKKFGIATLKEAEIEIQTQHSEDDTKKNEYTAPFKAFRGTAIRFSYKHVYH